MKRPISVTVAGIIYLILTALSVFVFASAAVYGGEALIQDMAEAYPFLPWQLSILVSIVFTALPVFVAVGIFSGNKAARWLAVFVAVISVGIVLTETEPYGAKKLAVQIAIHTVILLCLFNPAANRYFAQDKRPSENGIQP